MRNPKRIKRICLKLEKLWNKHPEERLGQLLENYIFGCCKENCIFHIEDDKIEERLDEIQNQKDQKTN